MNGVYNISKACSFKGLKTKLLTMLRKMLD